MPTRRTMLLVLAATFISGLLAGGNVDRALVAMPAWQKVGAAAWATFSRHADLANGLLLYPLEAFGGALLTFAAVFSLHFDQSGRRDALFPLYAALAFCIAGLGLTIKAAPIMLGIRQLNDPTSLQVSFEGFRLWGNLRGVFQVLAFVAQLCTLALLFRSDSNSASRR